MSRVSMSLAVGLMVLAIAAGNASAVGVGADEGDAIFGESIPHTHICVGECQIISALYVEFEIRDVIGLHGTCGFRIPGLL